MDKVIQLKVYAGEANDLSSIVEISETTTAEDILTKVAPKLLHISVDRLQEYALFIVMSSETPLKERMLAPFECPYQILVFFIQQRTQPSQKYYHVVKSSQISPSLVDDNVSVMEAIKDEEIIREGGLKKYTGTKWKDRYFILDSKCIYYGKSKKTLAKAFSRIDLEAVSVTDVEESRFGKYCFQLVTPHKVYVLKGNNTENKQKWMQSISKQCSITSENKAFEELNEKIRKAEMLRAARDEKLVSECQELKNLVSFTEGMKMLGPLIPDKTLRDCMLEISEYKSNVESKPAQALIKGGELLDFLEELGEDEGYLNKHEIEEKRSLLFDWKNARSSGNARNSLNHELFDDVFRRCTEIVKEKYFDDIKKSVEFQARLCRLPATIWQNRVRSKRIGQIFN